LDIVGYINVKGRNPLAELVGNYKLVGNPGCQPGLATEFPTSSPSGLRP